MGVGSAANVDDTSGIDKCDEEIDIDCDDVDGTADDAIDEDFENNEVNGDIKVDDTTGTLDGIDDADGDNDGTDDIDGSIDSVDNEISCSIDDADEIDVDGGDGWRAPGSMDTTAATEKDKINLLRLQRKYVNASLLGPEGGTGPSC